MKTFSLQSGSNGNCIYVEAGDVRLLFDAGISGKTAAARMESHGRDIRDVTALILSHDHNDHVSCAGVFHRKFGLPLYMTAGTHAAVADQIGRVSGVRHFRPGDCLTFGDVRVHTLRTPHDAVEGVCFVVEHEGRRLGILTDLGHPFDALGPVLSELHAAYIESNYDVEMLEKGPYPYYLKQRIRGHGGHLSNAESAELVATRGRGLEWAVLAHLSAENNHPTIAMHTHRRTVGSSFPLLVASRTEVGPMLTV